MLDYPHHRVSITPGSLPAADDQGVFDYPADEELPVIPVTIAGHVYRIGTIAIGAYPLELREVKFSDLRPGAGPGIGNVGAEVLRGFIVTFDAKNRRVKLERPSA